MNITIYKIVKKWMVHFSHSNGQKIYLFLSLESSCFNEALIDDPVSVFV